MAGPLARMIYAIDRILPGPRVGGRDSQQAYAEWEYGIGKSLLREYSSWFGDLGGKRVLDIGCGLGGKSVAYAEEGARVTSVDLDPVHTEGTLSYSRKTGIPIEVLMGDASSLPFLDGSFDLVVANDSMEHFAQPAPALEEFARVSRPGGFIFLFFTPWGSPLASHLYDYIHTPWCHLIYSEKMLEHLLELSFRRRRDDDPAGRAQELMSNFKVSNNRIDVAGYHRILGQISSLHTVYERLKPPRFSFLGPLTSIPHLGELFTGTVVAVLRKNE